MIREFARLFAEKWPKGAILWTVTALVTLALSIALQVAAQLLRGPIKREGPRLDDLSPTGVQPGAVMPRTKGHTVAPGTVIVQTRLKETKKKEEQGGKGSPSVESTTFTYSIPAIAVAFSAVPIGGIVRIKANEKVVYDATEGDAYRHFSEIEIFTGTETQAPSAILEAHEGAGNVPAYRGTAYFVLADLQLADFGNRGPVWKIECAEDFDYDIAVTEGDPETDNVFYDHSIIDWSRRRIYGQYDDGSERDESEFLDVYDLDTLNKVETLALPSPAAFNGVDEETGYLIGSHADPFPDFTTYLFDPATNSFVTTVINTAGHDTQSGFDYVVNRTGYASRVLKDPASGEKTILSGSTLDLIHANDFTTLALDESLYGPNPNATDPLDWWCSSIGVNDTNTTALALWGQANNFTEYRVYKYVIGNLGVITETFVGTILPSDVDPSLVSVTEAAGYHNPLHDPSDDSWVLLIAGSDGVSSSLWILKWKEGTGIVWATDITGRLTQASIACMRMFSKLEGDKYVFGTWPTDDFVEIDLVTGARTDINDVALGGTIADDAGQVWSDADGCVYLWKTAGADQILQKVCLTNASSGNTSIGAILRWSMTDWTPDVSPLVEGDHFEIDAALFAEPFLVTGATFTQLASPREIAEMCMIWKPCVFHEGGDRLKFRPRDGTRQATISHLDLGQRDREAEVEPGVVTSRADDVQLPREVRVKFLDENRMFSANAAYARITRSRSSLVQEQELPFAGTPADAKFAAWTAQGEAYAQRRSHAASLPLKYFILEPGDIIDLPTNEGDLIECRVTQSETGANNIIAMKASDHVNSYDNITFAAETGILDVIPLVRPELPITYVLDLPRLTDDPVVDDGLQMIVGLGGTYEQWKGGIIYRDATSGGGATAFGQPVGTVTQDFVEVAETRLSVDAGKIVTPPSGGVDEFTVDRVSTMRVAFDTFEPVFSTLTDAQFLTTAANAFAIGNNVDGWEIVQAQEVAQIDAQTWDFSVLRRGLRGTEWAIGQAEAGDTVVRIESGTLFRDAFVESAIGETITYRGVTFNMDVASAPDTDVVVVGRGLIPYSPLLGQAYRDAAGEITGTLYARPLQADDADQFLLVDPDFEIDILDGAHDASPAPSVLRTIVLTDTGAFTYTAAQQTTDFGATQSLVHARAYQLDDSGERGYAREIIL